jgi:hypothetical protein
MITLPHKVLNEVPSAGGQQRYPPNTMEISNRHFFRSFLKTWRGGCTRLGAPWMPFGPTPEVVKESLTSIGTEPTSMA